MIPISCDTVVGQVLRELVHRPVVGGGDRPHPVRATADGGEARQTRDPRGVGPEREGNLNMSDFFTAVAVRIQNTAHNVRNREEGQGLVEYVTLVALIALGLFVAIIAFKSELGTIFSKITDKIEAKLP